MIVTARGLKAWLWILGIIVLVIVGLVLVFQVVLFLLPIIIVIAIGSYLWRMLKKVKKEKGKDYIDVNFKIKKEK